MILHLLQIRFTDDLTFIALFKSINDSPPGKIVGRKLDGDLVPGENTYKVLSHFTGDMCQHLVFVFQLDTKHSVRQRLYNPADDFNWFFFGHKPSNRYRQISDRPKATEPLRINPFELKPKGRCR